MLTYSHGLKFPPTSNTENIMRLILPTYNKFLSKTMEYVTLSSDVQCWNEFEFLPERKSWLRVFIWTLFLSDLPGLIKMQILCWDISWTRSVISQIAMAWYLAVKMKLSTKIVLTVWSGQWRWNWNICLPPPPGPGPGPSPPCCNKHFDQSEHKTQNQI